MFYYFSKSKTLHVIKFERRLYRQFFIKSLRKHWITIEICMLHETMWRIWIIGFSIKQILALKYDLWIYDGNVLKSDHYHVSRLLNFFVTTLPMSIPSLSTILCANSGCDDPLNTLIFGILLCNKFPRELSKFARNKLLARTACETGITEKRQAWWWKCRKRN